MDGCRGRRPEKGGSGKEYGILYESFMTGDTIGEKPSITIATTPDEM